MKRGAATIFRGHDYKTVWPNQRELERTRFMSYRR